MRRARRSISCDSISWISSPALRDPMEPAIIKGILPVNPAQPRAGMLTYAGVFVVTMVTLMYEILLTRIFSVTMWYHFAFLAISIAMFGMTLGGLVVCLHPRYSGEERVEEQMGRASFLFSVWMVIGILTHVFVPFHTGMTLQGLASMSVTF